MAKATRKPSTKRPKPLRFIKPLGNNVYRIEVGKDWDHYSIVPIPCEVGGIAFSVACLTVEREAPLYAVRVCRPGVATCDCPGGIYRGRCKHADGILHLIKLGKLAGPQAKAA